MSVARGEDPGAFVILDRMAPSSRFMADMSLVLPRDLDAYGLRVDLYGEYMHRSQIANTMTYDADEVYWFHAVSLGVRYVSQSRWSPHVSYQIAFSSADGVAAHIVLAGVVYSVPSQRPDQWLALRR